MKLVADANILFAALLRDSTTRKLWFSPELELHAPEYLTGEFLKHKEELQRKFDGTPEELEKLYLTLLKQIRFISDNELAPYLSAAMTLSKDPKDWLYIAAALYSNANIWSNDADYLPQKRIKIWTTKELLEEMRR